MLFLVGHSANFQIQILSTVGEPESLKTANVNLKVALEKSQRTTKVIRIHHLGTMNGTRFCASQY